MESKDERIVRIRSKMRTALNRYIQTGDSRYINQFYRIFKFIVLNEL